MDADVRTPPVPGGGEFAAVAAGVPLHSAIAKTMKAAEDTVDGCESLAASDLARAALMDTKNGRRKLEQSAAIWQQRSVLLRSLDSSAQERRDLDKAEWDQADADELLYSRDPEADDVRI